jgi:hypothetical protein
MENEIKTIVQIADHSGHTVALMNKEQVIDLVSDSQAWIYAGDTRIDSDHLALSDWSNVGTISIMPAIQYG